MPISVLPINCTLKSSGESSTDTLLNLIIEKLETGGAICAPIVRVAGLNIKSGVSSDEGDGDEWPALRKKILAADILLIGTPIWMGQPSSISKRVLERLDAFLSDADDQGRTPAYGKVAAVAVVGNEDGAHHVSAELFQALADVGFTIAAGGPSYWVGEAMGKVDFKDLPSVPEKVDEANKMLAKNALHLAGLLSNSPYPGYK